MNFTILLKGLEMAFEFIKRLIRCTLATSIVGFLLISISFSLRDGVGIFIGGVWGSLNLYFLYNFFYDLLTPVKKNIKILIIFILKFPVLYGIGYWILQSHWFSPWSLFLGLFLMNMVLLINSYKEGMKLT